MNVRFNGEMLALARQVRKVSQPQLAEMLGTVVSQALLSRIENGRVQPEVKLVDRIASALRFHTNFFYNPSHRRMPAVSFHRRRQKLGQKELDAIHGQAEVHRLNLKKMLDAVELEQRLPTVPGIDPDEYQGKIDGIADTARQRWKIPRGPIPDLTKLVEDAGVVVIPFDFGTPLIDGFSQHPGDGLPAIVFLNSKQPKDRLRFSLAHELGHLIMHQTPRPDMEVEANRFASEFLMPRRDIEPHLYNLSIQKFMELKLYWRTSMQSLIYKSWETGRITDRMFKYYNIEMSRRGFRTHEPIQLPDQIEDATTLRELVRVHLSDLSYSPDELSEMFGLLTDEFWALYPYTHARPKLRLVQ